jgi:hypothetical protein
MNPADNIEQTIEKLHIATKPETDERILDDAFAALEKAIKAPSHKAGRNVRQNIFSNKILKFAAVAAAIIVISVLFLQGTISTMNTPGKIDAALTKAENICITKFLADNTEPYEQQWLSTTLNVKMIKSIENNRMQFALWDIPNKTKMQTFLSSNTVRTEPITENMLAEFEESMIQNSGLLQFFQKGNIPKDAVWKPVVDPAVTTQYPGTKIYELTWHQQGATEGEITYRKWRIFADAKTNLPARAEWYTNLQPDGQYGLESYTLFSYPKQEEIQTVIRSVFGPARRQPEYIGTPEY